MMHNHSKYRILFLRIPTRHLVKIRPTPLPYEKKNTVNYCSLEQISFYYASYRFYNEKSQYLFIEKNSNELIIIHFRIIIWPLFIEIAVNPNLLYLYSLSY